MRRKGLISLVLSVLLPLGGLVYTFVVGNSPLLGLDLQGGVSVVLQPVGEVEDGTLNQAISIIRSRVDAIGVAEPDITRQGDTIVVQLPGIEDREAALELVGTTAELQFRPVLGLGGAPGQTGTETEIPLTPEDAPDPAEGDGDVDTPPADEAPAEEEAPDGETPAEDPTAEVPAPDEQGLAPLIPGEQAAGGQTDTTEPAPPEDPPAEDPPAEDPPADDPPADEPPADEEAPAEETPTTIPPPALPGEEACQPGEPLSDAERDLPSDEAVVLPQVDDDNVITNCYQLGPVAFTGEVLSEADAVIDPTSGEWSVAVRTRGGDARAEANEGFNACFNGDPATCPPLMPAQSNPSGAVGAIAIALDGVVNSAPAVQGANLADDDFNISGEFSESEAKDLALILRYGALPVELEQQAVQEVSATLGQDALDAGVVAGLVGLALVALYMIAYYRLLGLIAVLSLGLSGAMLWTIVAYLGETQGLALTLAGVTGIIVSIGVSVDTNVVFYEDLKEDTVRGRTMRSSVEASFRTSFATIVKADVASLIGAVILYVLTVGPVRGFALFLGISVLLDLLASYFFMRPAVLFLAKSRRFQNRPRLVGVADARPIGAQPVEAVT